MAQRKKRALEQPLKRRGPGRPRKDEYEEEEEESWFELHPDTVRGIGVVVMLLLAVLSLLSLLDVAGSVGELLKEGLTTLFGWGRVVVPFWFALVAYGLLVPDSFGWRVSNSIGLLLTILGYSGILHLFVDPDKATRAIRLGDGGGYAGLALSYPLQELFGTWATAAILAAVFLIGLLLVFHTSLRSLSSLGGVLTWVKDTFYKISDWIFGGDDDDEEEMPEVIEEDAEIAQENAKFANKEVRANVTQASEQAELPMSAVVRKPTLRMRLSTDLLDRNTSKPQSGDIESNKEKIRNTLENFGIAVDMGDVNVGPTVTQYTLKPHEGVKLAQILTLQNDLALALAAHPIRIEAPIPGKSLVGIEVPNVSISMVRLREILESKTFKKRKSNLTLALGRDVAGEEIVVPLESMPHLLIAGATGSGKSVCINTLILSLLYQNSPDDFRVILVDPKRVEMTPYNDIPYLLTPVITEPKKTINALKWAVSEMERRYELLSHAGKRNIASYNDSKPDDHLPYIIIIIDELADLMAVAAQEVEATITRLAQMARAVGIHLIVATQRPSVDVITGLIKANITSRIAFTVASSVDSRTILDSSGAEKLLGRGDMLFISAEYTKPKRIQGVYVSDDEIGRVTQFLRDQGKPEFNDAVTSTRTRGGDDETVSTEDEDPLLDEAKEVVVSAGKASASLLQRRLRVGYSRAARLLDILEDQGIIGPPDGSRPREVLLTMEALEQEQHESFSSAVVSSNRAVVGPQRSQDVEPSEAIEEIGEDAEVPEEGGTDEDTEVTESDEEENKSS